MKANQLKGENMNIQDIKQAIVNGTFSNSELSEINEAVKTKRKMNGMALGAQIKVGDNVRLSGLSPNRINGLVVEVLAVNRTTVTCIVEGGRSSVPIACCEIV